MTRDVASLSRIEYDVLVIGGGIAGLVTAYDAAQRGLRVALVERGDFGGATSCNHLKTLHGGLRYLQHGDLRRVRRSILERRTFAAIAPHLVTPLRFASAVGGSATRSRAAFAAAFALDRWLGLDRNRGLPAHLALPPGRVVPARSCEDWLPAPFLPGVRHVATWYDYQMPEADRLTLAFAQAAVAHGATLSNYTAAEGLIVAGARVHGARVRDVAGAGPVFDVRAKVTVNAAGPWSDEVSASAGLDRPTPRVLALNVVTRRPQAQGALVGPSAAGRNLVCMAWRGHAVVGTLERDPPVPGAPTVTMRTLADAIAEIETAFPWLALDPADVTLVHRGLVPADVDQGTPTLRGRDAVVDHRRDGMDGLLSLVATKYTTARWLAECTVDALLDQLGAPTAPCRTALVPLPGAPATPSPATAPARDHLDARYGSAALEVRDLIRQAPELGRAVLDGQPLLKAEVVHAVRREMAVTLTDVVVRRTGVGAGGHPGPRLVAACAAVLADELGWDSTRTEREVEGLGAFYDPIG